MVIATIISGKNKKDHSEGMVQVKNVMKKTLCYILRIVVIIYAIVSCSLILSGIVLTFSEKEYSFIGMFIVGILLFILFIFLDRKLKSKIKELNTKQQTISYFNKSIEDTLLSDDNSIEIPSNKIYIENGHTVSHADSSSITEEEIPYLIEQSYQKALENERNSPNLAFHRTEREEELSFNFEYNSKKFDIAKQYIAKFKDLEQQALNESNYEKKMDLFNQTLGAYEKAKSFCYRTKGGMIWFQDMYEYLHNSQSPCFSYEDTIKNRIEYYTEIHLLEIQIHTIIEDNKEYLQKDLYKLFPNSSKGDVQRAVKNLVEQNIIEKTKQGSTYLLTIKNLALTLQILNYKKTTSNPA